MKTNFYEESVMMILNGLANQLTDEELLDLSKSLYGKKYYKENILIHSISDLQRIINEKEDICCESNVLKQICEEKIYLIYETLELKRAEIKGVDNDEN